MPNKSFELRRCSNYRKSNYRESTVLTYFGIPQLGYAIKTNFIVFQTVNPKISSVLIFL